MDFCLPVCRRCLNSCRRASGVSSCKSVTRTAMCRCGGAAARGCVRARLCLCHGWLPCSSWRQMRGGPHCSLHAHEQVSHIETEKLLVKMVAAELLRRKVAGTYRGKFAALSHFFGYEGRCSLPSNFDATYCNALGQAAGALVASSQTGLMATVSGEAAAPGWCTRELQRWESAACAPVAKASLAEPASTSAQTCTFPLPTGWWAARHCCP